MTTQFVTYSVGTKLAYDVKGSGPALILLHGAGDTRRGWHDTGYVERLQPDFTTITVDIRGTGESSFLTDTADYKIEEICADVYAVADACGAHRFQVWGFSFGGNIARYLAAWSDRVSAAAIIGAPFGPAVGGEFKEFVIEYVQENEALVRDYKEGRLSEKQRESATRQAVPVWVACFQAMLAWPDIEPEMLRCPTLLIAGTNNHNAMEWIDSNAAAIQNSALHAEVIDGIDHGQEFSEIDRVFPVASAFLKRTAADIK